MGIKVRAIARGYYGSLREEGDEFVVLKKEDLGTWMAPVDKLPGRQARPQGQPEDGEVLL